MTMRSIESGTGMRMVSGSGVFFSIAASVAAGDGISANGRAPVIISYITMPSV